MRRRDLLRWAAWIAALPLLPAALRPARALIAAADDDAGDDRLQLSDERWREILTPEQFRVLRREGTERPYSSSLNDEQRAGTFVCAGCFLPLFDAAAKYDSGTGWPSFWQPLPDRLGTKTDFKIGYPRTEYHCRRCGGHQGHVFDDGPPPTGERYCNNGVALAFVPEGEALPELRS